MSVPANPTPRAWVRLGFGATERSTCFDTKKHEVTRALMLILSAPDKTPEETPIKRLPGIRSALSSCLFGRVKMWGRPRLGREGQSISVSSRPRDYRMGHSRADESALYGLRAKRLVAER